MPGTTSTVRLHRVIAAKPEKIFRAFTDADAFTRWLPPNGFTGKMHHMNAKPGGTFKMSFTNFTTRDSHSFGGNYLDLRPDEYVSYTTVFDNPGLPGMMTVTVNLRAVSVGTDMSIVQEGIPAAIPLEACYLGWQQSLDNLKNLVEPDIAG